MNSCCIGLGGNVGDVERTFEQALRRLEQSSCRVVARSVAQRSAAMGDAAGADFCNAAARIETRRDPGSMLQLLRQTEDALGRQRATHWGPRTLDLDLLLFGDEIVDTNVLAVPHPGLWYRRFVLDPLMEFAEDDRHPQFGQTIRELRQRLNVRPLVIEVAADDQPVLDFDDVEIRPMSGFIGEPCGVNAQMAFARVQADDVVPPGGIRRRHENGFVVCCHPEDVDSTVKSVATAALGV